MDKMTDDGWEDAADRRLKLNYLIGFELASHLKKCSFRSCEERKWIRPIGAWGCLCFISLTDFYVLRCSDRNAGKWELRKKAFPLRENIRHLPQSSNDVNTNLLYIWVYAILWLIVCVCVCLLCFLEPPCHLPPNSNNVVDQQLLYKPPGGRN